MNKKIGIIILFFILLQPVWAQEQNNEIIYKIKNSKVNVAEVNDDQNIDQQIIELQKNPDIEFVEPNYYRYIQVEYNDYYFPELWHLSNNDDNDIDVKKAWQVEMGKASTIIAVLDTGVDIDHEDLADNIWFNSGEVAGNGIDDDNNGYIDDINGWDFISDNNNVNPNPNGRDGDVGVTHGTHVAGIAASNLNNSIGGAGVCPNCSIMVVQVMNDEGVGTISAIASGIDYAINNGADIINLSFGSYDVSQVEAAAIKRATDAGVIVVAAAGNDGVNINKEPLYPCCQAETVCVGATNKKDNAAGFSNYGKECVDISAPGKLILSAWYTNDSTYGFTDDYGYISGTSMATPVVSGIMGLVKSYQSSYSRKKIQNYVIDSGEKNKKLGDKMGSGRVNAYQSIKAVKTTSRPYRPEKIKAYTGQKKTYAIKAKTFTNEQTPYFTWKKAQTKRGEITGYYVYWGRKKNANPVKRGKFQTKRKFQPRKKINRDNETIYYLKIKSKNSLNKKSKKPKIFQYVYRPN